MAIKILKSITSKSAVTEKHLQSVESITASVSDELYVKVQRVNADKTTAQAFVIFKGEKITGANDYAFQVDLNGANFISQAYNHLKTLPEFAGAINC